MVDGAGQHTQPEGKRGRWRTGGQSRQRVLDAARSRFAQQGYDRTTMRAIAADAAVDPSMIHYFFGTKEQLFAAAMKLPGSPREKVTAMIAEGLDDLASRLLRRFLEVWDNADDFEPLVLLLRSAPTHDTSAAMLRSFIEREISQQLIDAVGTDDAALRVSLFNAHLIGIAVARYIVGSEPIASADPDTLVAWMAPRLQSYLTDPSK